MGRPALFAFQEFLQPFELPIRGALIAVARRRNMFTNRQRKRGDPMSTSDADPWMAHVSVGLGLMRPWMAPYRVISWERAVVMLYSSARSRCSRSMTSASMPPRSTLRTPAVVRLTRARVSTRKNKVRFFSDERVLARRFFRCQYCGEKKQESALNYDHVLPRMRGGKTVWENIASPATRVTSGRGAKLLKRPG